MASHRPRCGYSQRCRSPSHHPDVAGRAPGDSRLLARPGTGGTGGDPYQATNPGRAGTATPDHRGLDGTDLTLTLPSGRTINYPGAHLIPNSKFEDADPDIEFFDNARGQWKPARAWYGMLVENVVQGTARDLLAAAIIRAETRGWKVVFHCHDELVVR